MADLGDEGTGANTSATQGVGNGGMAASEGLQPDEGGRSDHVEPAALPELHDNEYYRKKLDDERAKRKKSEDRCSKLRNDAIPLKTYFGNVKISKEDSFPQLYSSSSDNHNRLSPSDGLVWLGNVDSWLSSHGAMGLRLAAKTFITLTGDGKKRMPILPESPDNEKLESMIEGQRLVMIKVSKTEFANYVLLPTEDEIVEMNTKEIRSMFAQFSMLCMQLSARLRKAATPPGAQITVMHDIFGVTNEAVKSSDGLNMHPLAGIIELLQIQMRFNTDPQGTALQLKNKLMDRLKGLVHESSFTLHQLEPLMHTTNAELANILSKEPLLKESVEMEVGSLVCQIGRAACRRTRGLALGKVSDAMLDAAEMISAELMKCATTTPHVQWYDLQSKILVATSSYLPPADAVKQKTVDPTQHALALLSEQGYEVNKKGGKPQQQQGGNKGGKGGKGGSNNNNKPADKAPENNDRYAGWTCEKCGLLNHNKWNCPNPANPKAAELVERAKIEKAEARVERMKKQNQRSFMQRQGEEMGHQDKSNEPTPKKQRTDGQSSGSKNVAAGFAAIDWRNTVTPNRAEENVFGYHASEEINNYPAPPPYSNALAAVVETVAPDMITWMLMLSVGIMGVLIAAMTPFSRPFQALGQVNVGAIVYVVLMSLLHMNIPDFQGNVRQTASIACGMMSLGITAAFWWTTWMDTTALGVFNGFKSPSEKGVYVDSGCTHSVFSSKNLLLNMRAPDRNYVVRGVGGQIRVTHIGDFPLTLRDDKGNTYVKYVRGCLYAPEAFANLLSASDLCKLGIGFEMPPNQANGQLTMEISGKGKLVFPLQKEQGLQRLPMYKTAIQCISGASTHHFRSLTTAELWHLRLGHASSHKIAKLSTHCKGILQPLAENHFPCHHCTEAKIEHNNLPAPSDGL